MDQTIKSSMVNLLNYVKENVSFYNKILQNIDVDNSVESVYEALPYMTKAMMRDSGEHINQSINETNAELVVKLTGGTTGEPWNITKTQGESTSYFCMLWKSRLQFGIKPGDHFYQFGGYGDIDGEYTTQQVIVVTPYTELSMFHLNNEVLDRYIELIQQGNGNWFFANPSALYILALRMKDRGIKGIGKIKYVELTGERVYDYQEELIKEVFNCPVSIMYGSREITTISHRCKYGSHHILPHLYIETIDNEEKVIDYQNDKQLGEVVITSFIDKYMPFIKYKTGDYAVIQRKDDCPCGRKGLVFEQLLGRVPAYAEVDGNKINMEITYYLMEKFNRTYGSGIRQFQAIFKKPNIFRFRIVVESPDICEMVCQFYDKELKAVIPNIKVEVEFVDIIERSKRKLNPFIIED
ncbi:MAG: CoF synthetase [Herbinix sp.]|jgi:phenylacetate-CoA ligase|nr:CoF synthetase [Herbinix sp.]